MSCEHLYLALSEEISTLGFSLNKAINSFHSFSLPLFSCLLPKSFFELVFFNFLNIYLQEIIFVSLSFPSKLRHIFRIHPKALPL